MISEAGKRIGCIILAAGESRRMGKPKALLALRGTSFIRHLVDVFKSSMVSKTVVVLGADSDKIERELAGQEVTIALNPEYIRGQLSSLLAGMKALGELEPEALLIHPVDHPCITTELINTLVNAFVQSSYSIVLPTFNRRRGHPVLFSASLFDELRVASPEVGARSVVWYHAADVLEVRTDNEGTLLNIDTPEDYERLRRGVQEPPDLPAGQG